jgi:hypothetical protein
VGETVFLSVSRTLLQLNTRPSLKLFNSYLDFGVIYLAVCFIFLKISPQDNLEYILNASGVVLKYYKGDITLEEVSLINFSLGGQETVF